MNDVDTKTISSASAAIDLLTLIVTIFGICWAVGHFQTNNSMELARENREFVSRYPLFFLEVHKVERNPNSNVGYDNFQEKIFKRLLESQDGNENQARKILVTFL